MRFTSDARLALGLLLSSLLALSAFVYFGFATLPARVLREPTTRGPARATVEAGTEFVDITERVGLDSFRHDTNGVHSIEHAVAPGLALLDLDKDDDLDLVLIGGSEAPAGISIFLNQLRDSGRPEFEDATESCGITWRGESAQGICAADVDHDGDVDLFVTALGRNLLLQNQLDGGRLAFEDVTEDSRLVGSQWHYVAGANLEAPSLRHGPRPEPTASGPATEDVKEFSTGASFGDFDLDGDPDLYVANYVAYSPELRLQWARNTNDQTPDRSEPLPFQPRTFEPLPDRLYRNDGGTFVDVSKLAHVSDTDGRGLGAIFVRADGDLYPDVCVAVDAGPNVFFHNVANESREAGEPRRHLDEAGAAFGLNDRRSGMGIARGDANGDGLLDLLTTNWFEPASLFLLRLQTGPGADEVRPYFEEQGQPAGLAAATATLVGWGCVFFDYDNDGDPDLFLGNGFTSPREGSTRCAPERLLLFQNLGNGQFVDVTSSAGAALRESYSARGVVTGDVDRDGDLDLVFAQNNDRVVVLENRLRSNDNHSLVVQLDGGPKNRNVINAQVVVDVRGRRQIQELLSGGSYLSQGPFELHFGLGPSPLADGVRVSWPRVVDPTERERVRAGQLKLECEER